MYVSEHVDNLQGSLHCLHHVSFWDLTQDVNFLHLGTLPAQEWQMYVLASQWDHGAIPCLCECLSMLIFLVSEKVERAMDTCVHDCTQETFSVVIELQF